MTSAKNGQVVRLPTRPIPDDSEEADEVAEREPTMIELEEHDRATKAVPRAVDPPATHLGLKELTGIDLPERRLLVPKWLLSWVDFKQVAWWLTRYVAYLVTYHGLRVLPVYLPRVLAWSSRGVLRFISEGHGWLWDSQGRAMALAAHDSGDQKAWKTARKDWRETVHRRLVGSALSTALLVVVLAVLTWANVLWVWLALGAGAVGTLTWLGRPKGKPLLDVAMTKPGQPWRMTSAIIIEALGSIGDSRINAAVKTDPKSAITFTETIQHDGPGWRVVVDLPKGVTATDVIEKREALAAGLRRPLGTVWPEGVRNAHPGRLMVYVGDEDMNVARQPPWPLLKSGQADVFRPGPFGTDQRMRPVWTTLAYASFVIGAVPRMGKTFALRLLMLIAALDPRCRLYVHDNKGMGDMSPFEHVAHAYTVGDEPEDILVALKGLRELREERRRRTKLVNQLTKSGRARESKVTPELASDPQLGLFPIVLAVDETQVWFEHKKYGEEFKEICTDLVKMGPAALIITLVATQRPDAGSIPKTISDNVVFRLCLKVIDAMANNMVLGSGRYAAGVRATMFAFEDKGIGYYAGEGADPKIIKTYYVDADEADKVCRRARRMRERAGTLSGYAIGEQEIPDESASLADDLPRVFATAERLHSEDVIEALQELRPRTYDGWTKNTLAAATRDQLSLKTRQVRIGEKVAAGLYRDAVLDAIGHVVALPRGAEEGSDTPDEGGA